MRTRFFSTISAGILGTYLLIHQAAANDQVQVQDSFESPKLSAIWSDKDAPAERLSFRSGEARDGKQSLALAVRPGDFDAGCKCQRTEIREADEVQPEFGSDLWYRFSLRMTDITGGYDDSRWMLGAWKQEVEGSPFLAMRFESGVFYITLESATTRVMLGSTLIDARAFIQIMKGGEDKKFDFITDPELYIGESGITLSHGKMKYLPDPRNGWVDLIFRIKGGLKGDGIVEVYANDQFVVRASGKIGVDAPVGSKQYMRLGHRRDKSSTGATLLIDDFRRGVSLDAVSD
jgi:hypothetical protein